MGTRKRQRPYTSCRSCHHRPCLPPAGKSRHSWQRRWPRCRCRERRDRREAWCRGWASTGLQKRMGHAMVGGARATGTQPHHHPQLSDCTAYLGRRLGWARSRRSWSWVHSPEHTAQMRVGDHSTSKRSLLATCLPAHNGCRHATATEQGDQVSFCLFVTPGDQEPPGELTIQPLMFFAVLISR